MTCAIGLAVAGLFGVFLGLGVRRHARVLRPPPGTRWPSALTLQRAGSGRAMAPLLERLGAAGREAHRQALVVDGTMIAPAYAGLLAVLSLLTILPIRAHSDDTVTVLGVAAAVGAAVVAIVAALLDLVENAALARVLGRWRDIEMPPKPNDVEAAERQELRRGMVTAIDPDCRAAARNSSRKFVLLAVVILWLLAGLTIAVTGWLG